MANFYMKNPKRTRCIIEFFYNSPFPAKSWQDHASIDREEQNKTIAPTED